MNKQINKSKIKVLARYIGILNENGEKTTIGLVSKKATLHVW